jgi:hypothetical protein
LFHIVLESQPNKHKIKETIVGKSTEQLVLFKGSFGKKIQVDFDDGQVGSDGGGSFHF